MGRYAMIGSVSNNSSFIFSTPAKADNSSVQDSKEADVKNPAKDRPGSLPLNSKTSVSASILGAISNPEFSRVLLNLKPFMETEEKISANGGQGEANEDQPDEKSPIGDSEDGAEGGMPCAGFENTASPQYYGTGKKEKAETIYKALQLPDGTKILQIITIMDGKTSVTTQKLPSFSGRLSEGETIRVTDMREPDQRESANQPRNEFIF
jgi:hypothetical protein